MNYPKHYPRKASNTAPAAGRRKTWQEIEADFRLWSFYIYYDRSFADVASPTERFAKALLASIRPIRSQDSVEAWYDAGPRVAQLEATA